MLFIDRKHAGKLLAKKLSEMPFSKLDTIVLAIPRGGVPLGYQIAKTLNIPLDIILVKKIGAPHYPELAIGAVSEDEEVFYNYNLMAELGLTPRNVGHIKEEATANLQKIGEILRKGHPAMDLQNKKIILVDDGIATGATLESVIQVLKKRKVKEITIAAPVAAAETADKLSKLVDRVVILETPYPLYSVGEWYSDFRQVETQEAVDLLQEFAKEEIILPHLKKDKPGEMHERSY